MTFLLRANFLVRGRHLMHQTSIFNSRNIANLDSRYLKQKTRDRLSQARSFASEPKNLVPENRERLYEGTLHKRIRVVKIFSLATSTGSLLCQPYLVSKALETGNSVGVGGIIFVFGFFAFVTPILLHLITKRYVAYVDYNPTKDTYIATTYSLFVRPKELEFKPEDVELPKISEMLTSCLVKGKPMFMDVKLFTDIDHYKRIMGFDKPMDFSLDTEDENVKKR